MRIAHQTHFTIAFKETPEPIVDVWQVLTEFLKRRHSLPKLFEVSQIAGHREGFQSERLLKLSADEMRAVIIERGLNGFWVEAGKSSRCVEYFITNAKAMGPQAEFRCRIGSDAKVPRDWTELIELIAMLFPTICSSQWDLIYQSWQWNSCLELGYERAFGPIPPGFRRQYEASIDGMGKGRTLLDISLNPGRPKKLLPGVSFYLAAEMWLGPHFWQYAKCTKEEVLTSDFFLEKRDTPHYLYLKCWPHPFTRPDGEQGRMQQRLWRLFFQEDCEWPPGSGTICNEPMYGPPELMPG